MRGEVGNEGSLRPKTRMITIIIEITGNTYGRVHTLGTRPRPRGARLNRTRPTFRFRPLITYTAKERIAKGASCPWSLSHRKERRRNQKGWTVATGVVGRPVGRSPRSDESLRGAVERWGDAPVGVERLLRAKRKWTVQWHLEHLQFANRFDPVPTHFCRSKINTAIE